MSHHISYIALAYPILYPVANNTKQDVFHQAKSLSFGRQTLPIWRHSSNFGKSFITVLFITLVLQLMGHRAILSGGRYKKGKVV